MRRLRLALGTEMARDNFTQPIKDALARRIAYKCSNPTCANITTGPHSDPSKSVNLGVACHITAASPGGPRFDPLLSPEQRASSENGIWLCQSCAKLIDSDFSRYPTELLRRWKVEAEATAARAMNGTPFGEFFPQPPEAVHTPIPKIAGLPYEEARALLIGAGWQPLGYSMAHASEPTLQAGNGLLFWQKEFYEIINASPTGLAYCRFGYRDAYGNRLTIITSGEVLPELGATAHVCGWGFENGT